MNFNQENHLAEFHIKRKINWQPLVPTHIAFWTEFSDKKELNQKFANYGEPISVTNNTLPVLLEKTKWLNSTRYEQLTKPIIKANRKWANLITNVSIVLLRPLRADGRSL